jgi:hypothetical protein
MRDAHDRSKPELERSSMKHSVHTGVCVLLAAGAALAPACLMAQTQLDVHANYSTGTTTHNKSWGGGIGAQSTFGAKSSPIALSVAPSLDYLKQQNGGPSQTTVSADLDVQPGGSSTVTPYVGVSAGANWSGGSGKMWQGSKLGLETIAGAQVKLGLSGSSVKAEERFGYVREQEHTLTTRVGFLISF